jgi:O-methyltransferase
MRIVETAKFLAYRMPVINRLMSPKYRYKVSPGQLAVLIGLIDATRSAGGSVIEVGVAHGASSVFMLEHMKSVEDERPVLLFDTFEGFTAESIAFEVTKRGKVARQYDSFRYGDEQRFRKRLRMLGYERFETFRGDASKFDWSTVAPIGVVHLDIDLYQPTKQILDGIWPFLVSGGGVVVDDCQANSPYDGSLQAYEEFLGEHNLLFERAGSKGGVVRKLDRFLD